MLSKTQAMEEINSFLEIRGRSGAEITLELQGSGDCEECVWAFWVNDSENTSYIHADGSIESYGL